MSFSEFFLKYFHRIKRAANIKDQSRRIRAAWAEESNKPLNFATMINGFTAMTSPILNLITSGEVTVSRTWLHFFYFLHVNLVFGILFQIIFLFSHDLDLVNIVNGGAK